MADLSPRKQLILRAVVIEHVTTAEPVSSDVITQKYPLGVRSATVRNEMAEITDLGLLEQPHTSSGRVPSDVGYRFFVDSLVVGPVIEDDQQRLSAVTGEDEALKQIVTETTKVLSRLTRNLSAALTVRDGGVLVRHVALSAMGPEKGLVVVVLQNGHVDNRVVDLPKAMTLDDLGAVNEALTALISGRKLSQVARSRAPVLGGPLEKPLRAAHHAVQTVAKELLRGHLVTEGEEYIFRQPEFIRHPEALESLVEQMEAETPLIEAIGRTIVGDGADVKIGRENELPSMQALSVVRQRFYVGEDEAGTLAIIGPRRMDYERNLAMLGFTAHAISQTLTKMLG